MEYFIYILYSPSSDRYYVGHTYNLEARLKDHNEGMRSNQHKKFTYKHRPWSLVASFSVGSSRAMAMKVEKYIKAKKSRRFIEEIISHKADPKKIAQLVGVPIDGINQ